MAERADVLVVGAGAVGLCAAYTLRQAGCDVRVVSREPVGEGASAGNAGMIVPSHVVPLAAPGVVAQGLRWLTRPESPFYIKPRLNLDLARWLWTFRRHCTEAHVRRSIPILRDLSLASVILFNDLQDEIGDVGFAQTGLLMLYHTEKGRKENLKAADLAEGAGLELERLDAGATRALEPQLRTPVEGAILYQQDGRVDPDAFLHRLAGHLTERGVTIRGGVTVTGLATRGGTITAVETTQGMIHAEEVILAAGAWTGELASDGGLTVPVQPAKGYSITVPALENGPHLPMILTEEKITVTPMPGRLRFAGTLALSGFDPSVDARRVAPIRRLARTYGPDAEVEAAAIWSGFRPCSPDGLPIIGCSDRYPNLILATGHGMMGVTLAPITGRLVADLVQGTTPPVDPAPLHPSRF